MGQSQSLTTKKYFPSNALLSIYPNLPLSDFKDEQVLKMKLSQIDDLNANSGLINKEISKKIKDAEKPFWVIIKDKLSDNKWDDR